MNLFVPDYISLYKLQDKVLAALGPCLNDFYLTGGTALGRFYLNHRYSEDLDFFINRNDSFTEYVTRVRAVVNEKFKSGQSAVLYPDFVRIWASENQTELKLEFVNDVEFRWGITYPVNGIHIDNPANILSNKIGAMMGRDEPKDIFDIIHIALAYSFNWQEVFSHSVRKAVVAEQNAADRLSSFPPELIGDSPWLKAAVDKKDIKEKLQIISDDFLFARDNSLGKGKPDILEARPREIKI